MTLNEPVGPLTAVPGQSAVFSFKVPDEQAVTVGTTVTGAESVVLPFESVKHLLSGKPLMRSRFQVPGKMK